MLKEYTPLLSNSEITDPFVIIVYQRNFHMKDNKSCLQYAIHESRELYHVL